MNFPFLFPSEGASGQAPVDGHAAKPPVVPSRKFTLQELGKYNGCGGGEAGDADGEQQSPIYVALLGYVYDVSKARHMYGPDGPYAVFAGRDATRGLAAFNINLQEDSSSGHRELSQRHLDNARRWESLFSQKYPVVGELILESASGESTSPMLQSTSRWRSIVASSLCNIV